MFKIHPKVPECMSDAAKCFIMNCFTPNPDDRATAAELLMDTFLRSSPRRKARAVQEPERKDFLTAGEASVLIKLTYCSFFSHTCCQFSSPSLSELFPIPIKKKNLYCYCTYYDTCVVGVVMKPVSLTTIPLCFAADYQRSLSVPVSILVEDTDSYSDSIDLSCSLDLRRPQSTLRADEISESPPSASFLL